MISISIRDFKRIGNLLKSPYRLKKTELIDFLCDVKQKSRGVIEYSIDDIMKLSKDDLIIEYDGLRNRVHHSAELFFLLFPTLKKDWLDKLSSGKLAKKEIIRREIERIRREREF
ncbi:MAG: hypothetical protein ACOC1X_00310 [Promethearchaeota archaeon]